MSFVLLWGKILDSSLWVKESKETRLVWITILAMKDSDGVIQTSVPGLAYRARVSDDECKKALKVLCSPDPGDTSKVDEGRRIREIPGGWQVVNHDHYRFSTDTKREFWRQQKAAQRAEQAEKDRRIKAQKAKTRREEKIQEDYRARNNSDYAEEGAEVA